MDMKEVLKAAIKDALQIALEQGELPEGAYPEAHCGNDHFPYEL